MAAVLACRESDQKDCYMKRRQFSHNMVAAGLAAPFIVTGGSPALANREFNLDPFARVRLIMVRQQMTPRSVYFMNNRTVSHEINLRRKVPQSNEDRAYIPGLNKPTLTITFDGARNIGEVRVHKNVLVVVPRVRLAVRYDSINIANQGKSFLIGDVLKPADNGHTVPGLNKLPVVGRLFRSKTSDTGLRSLLITVTPTIVKPG